MSRYNGFLTAFIIAFIATMFFFVFYMRAFFILFTNAHTFANPAPNEFFSTLFSPAVIISFIIMAIAGLLYRILGIVYVAKNKTIADGEKVLWVLGFLMMGFVTGIIFLILAKGKKLAE